MKQLISLIALFLCQTGYCQTKDSIPEPEFSFRPYYLKGSALLNLERLDATYDTKVVAMGYGGASSFYTVFEPKSEVRFSRTSLPKFYIKLEGKIDISDGIVVVSIGEIKKDRRRFKTASSALGGKSRDISGTIIKPTLRKIREGLYEITFENGLAPGEYAFMPIIPPDATLSTLSAKPKLCCFGVD